MKIPLQCPEQTISLKNTHSRCMPGQAHGEGLCIFHVTVSYYIIISDQCQQFSGILSQDLRLFFGVQAAFLNPFQIFLLTAPGRIRSKQNPVNSV